MKSRLTEMQPYSGAQGRLDFSGIRGGLKRPLQKRDGNFPYDKQTDYGDAKMDKSLSQAKDAGSHPIVPKNTEHSAWDKIDDIEPEQAAFGEAAGTPMSIGKASNTGDGSTVPGSAKGWSSFNPDDEEMTDDELSKMADVPPAEAQSYQNMMPASRYQYGAGPQKRTMNGRENVMRTPWDRLVEGKSPGETEVANLLTNFSMQRGGASQDLRDYGIDDYDEVDRISSIAVDPDDGSLHLEKLSTEEQETLRDIVQAVLDNPKIWTADLDEPVDVAATERNLKQWLASQKKSGTLTNGVSRSSWDRLHEAFVSMKQTPEGQMSMGQGIDEAELECAMDEYAEQSKKASDHLDTVDEAEGLKFLFTLDPDHAAKSLASVGKDKIKDTYKTWADRSGPDQAQPHDAELDEEDGY